MANIINLILLGQFMRLVPSVLLSKGRLFLGAILANATEFTNPRPLVTVFQISLDDLDAANQAYLATGSKADKLVLNEKRAVVEDNCRQLATYANGVANRNRVIAALTLMELRKEASPVPPISVVETPVLVTLTTGKMRSRTKAVTGARMYKHCITDDLSKPVNTWEVVESTQATVIFNALTPGKIYHICIAACGIDMQCVYSDYATKMAV
jgi:predicted membrane-bound mannosyltransferase